MHLHSSLIIIILGEIRKKGMCHVYKVSSRYNIEL